MVGRVCGCVVVEFKWRLVMPVIAMKEICIKNGNREHDTNGPKNSLLMLPAINYL